MTMFITQKLGMMQVFDQDGNAFPVTTLRLLPNFVVQNKTIEKDGYNATKIGVQTGYKINRPTHGILDKAKIKQRVSNFKEHLTDRHFEIGDQLNFLDIKENQDIEIKSTSKGKGFSGTIKRHGFSRGPKTHGSNNYRQPGSIGSAYPQRVVKGKKMAGHMGFENITVKGSKIIKVDLDKNIILVKGPVPGANKSFVRILLKPKDSND